MNIDSLRTLSLYCWSSSIPNFEPEFRKVWDSDIGSISFSNDGNALRKSRDSCGPFVTDYSVTRLKNLVFVLSSLAGNLTSALKNISLHSILIFLPVKSCDEMILATLFKFFFNNMLKSALPVDERVEGTRISSCLWVCNEVWFSIFICRIKEEFEKAAILFSFCFWKKLCTKAMTLSAIFWTSGWNS